MNYAGRNATGDHHGIPNEIILSFFDTLIYGRDLDLLQGKQWINDVLIGFYIEYLEKCLYSDYRADIALLHPDVVFACASGDGDFAADITKDLNLSTKKFVLLPLNNNESVEHAGGTHWSLLVYNRNDNTFQHLDSWSGHNAELAGRVSAVMLKALGITQKPALTQVDVPQQSNGYDCGMYVMCFSECLCSSLLKNEPLNLESVTAGSVLDKRKSLYDLILHLREIL